MTMKDIETLIGDLQEDYDLLTYDKEQESAETTKIANDLAMAIVLLKEQKAIEPKKIVYEYFRGEDYWRTIGWLCGKCGKTLTGGGNYCSYCGQAVKWNDKSRSN